MKVSDIGPIRWCWWDGPIRPIILAENLTDQWLEIANLFYWTKDHCSYTKFYKLSLVQLHSWSRGWTTGWSAACSGFDSSSDQPFVFSRNCCFVSGWSLTYPRHRRKNSINSSGQSECISRYGKSTETLLKLHSTQRRSASLPVHKIRLISK